MKFETPREWSSHTVWTNVFFALAGLFGFVVAGTAAIIPISALLFLAYGSWAYHFYLDDRGNKLDWAAMYTTSVAFSYYFGPGEIWWLLSLIIASYLIWVLIKDHERDFKYLAYVNAPLGVLIYLHMPIWIAIAITLVFAFAIYLRMAIEEKYTGTTRKALHGFWHLLAAIGYGLMFL